MRTMAVFFLSVGVVLGVALGACADPAALIGAAFADVYRAFGPIFALHGAYGDYLFEGTPVRVPQGLDLACDAFSLELANLHLVWSLQTASGIAAPSSTVRLRVEADAFCMTHGARLAAMAAAPLVAPSALQTASDAGLFAAVFDVNELLERTFTHAFEDLENDAARWSFSVAFATRTLVGRVDLARVDDLAGIFYGGEDRTEPPYLVSPEIREDMERAIALSGRSLEVVESAEARTVLERICTYFEAWTGYEPAE